MENLDIKDIAVLKWVLSLRVIELNERLNNPHWLESNDIIKKEIVELEELSNKVG